MYLARFEGPDGEVLQAVLRLEGPCSGGAWPDGVSAALLAGLSMEGSSLALRTQVEGSAVERTLFLTFPEQGRAALEALIERLAELPGLAPRLSETKSQHDELVGRFPQARQAWLRPGSYRAGEYRLASDFRLFSIVEPFFEAAVEQGWRLAYQVNLLRQVPGSEDLRHLKKQLVGMELEEGFPESLYSLQTTIVDRLPEARFLLDEVVGCASDAGWDYLERLVDEVFAVRMRRYGFSESPLEQEPGDLLRDSIATGFQLEMLQESDPVARAAASVTPEYADALLRWSPPVAPEEPPAARSEPGVEIDVFVSYSSPDRRAAFAVCRELEGRGLACWIAPRDVGAGNSYPEAIMRGLRAAGVLVLLFSEHANASPHVEREVERAVSLQTPVLALRLADITPSGSLEYLISTSHWQESENPPSREDLESLAEGVGRLAKTS